MPTLPPDDEDRRRAPDPVDRRALARQFDRRADDRADWLLRELEHRMFERLDLVRRSPADILDAGCGVGAAARRFAARDPAVRVAGIDLSVQRLARARSETRADAGWLARLRASLPGRAGSAGLPGPVFAAADTLRLPFRDSAFDLVWSNAVLHLLPDIPAAFAEWRRVLRAEGLLMFTAFGVDSFTELRAAGARLPAFPDLHDLGDMLVRAGFAEPVMDVERLRLTWADPARLVADLHALAGIARPDRHRGLRGRAWRDALLARLETLRPGPGEPITLTLELVHGHAWCPLEAKLPAGVSPLRFVPSRGSR